MAVLRGMSAQTVPFCCIKALGGKHKPLAECGFRPQLLPKHSPSDNALAVRPLNQASPFPHSSAGSWRFGRCWRGR
jgi:hypothetical protein